VADDGVAVGHEGFRRAGSWGRPGIVSQAQAGQSRPMNTPRLTIDFVSDVSCPWCAIGLGGLEQALQRLDGEVAADISFQPFELNPQMGAEGQDITEHLTQKYGS